MRDIFANTCDGYWCNYCIEYWVLKRKSAPHFHLLPSITWLLYPDVHARVFNISRPTFFTLLHRYGGINAAVRFNVTGVRRPLGLTGRNDAFGLVHAVICRAKSVPPRLFSGLWGVLNRPALYRIKRMEKIRAQVKAGASNKYLKPRRKGEGGRMDKLSPSEIQIPRRAVSRPL